MAANLKASHMLKKQKKSFFHEVKNELKKISWTTKAELITCTKIVLGATFVFGIGIYVADLAVRGLLNLIHFVAQLIFG